MALNFGYILKYTLNGKKIKNEPKGGSIGFWNTYYIYNEIIK